MKKRVKLLTTIASLCLAVALMAFGVYAATSVSFSVTSTINFTSTEITGYWTIVVDGTTYGGAESKDQTVTASPELGVAGDDDTFAYSASFKNESTSVAYVKVTRGDFSTNTDSALAFTEIQVTGATDTDDDGVYELAAGGTITYTFDVTYTASKLKDKTQTGKIGEFILSGIAANTVAGAEA